MSKIFIQIASYRDPQLIPTIKDMLANAKKPKNLVLVLQDNLVKPMVLITLTNIEKIKDLKYWISPTKTPKVYVGQET